MGAPASEPEMTEATDIKKENNSLTYTIKKPLEYLEVLPTVRANIDKCVVRVVNYLVIYPSDVVSCEAPGEYTE